MQTTLLKTSGLAAAAALAWTSVSARITGRYINYDRSKQFTAKAVVTEFKYVNPHAQLFFDVTDDRGGSRTGAVNCCRIPRS